MIGKAIGAFVASTILSIAAKMTTAEGTFLYFTVLNTLMLQDLLEISQKRSKKRKR